MRHYSIWLDKYSRRRTQILDSWSGLATTVEDIKKKIPPEKLFKELDGTGDLNTRMCFVDGGEGLRELIGLGVYFIRASGLILTKSGQEGQCELFTRDLDMNVIDYDDHTKERVELLRDGMEYDVAIKCVENHKPQVLFLDGSLYVKARKKPIKCLEYELYRKKYARLLKLCKKESVRLVGVSEDSKSRLLSNHLAQEHNVKFPKFMTDSTILRIFSGSRPYRTIEFTPQTKFETEDIIDRGIVSSFHTAYMQPTELSNPLRIDVPNWEEDFNGIISLVAALCKGSGQYGYPLPLYIAHMDAHIPPSQMDWTVKQVVNYVSKRNSTLANAVLKATRRNSRPDGN
jgi:hypothetical protein